MSVFEVNFDGLIGPTHNYAGLSRGNLASAANAHACANPRAAALQGLHKMKRLGELGLHQGVLPPHERPHLGTLRRLGFHGSDERLLAQAATKAPELLAAVSSASAAWVANAATITPAADSEDGRTHITPANLVSMFHRSIESGFTARLLRRLFAESDSFCLHDPLPADPGFGDEGAANHTRLCADYDEPGVELFVYGRRRGAAAPQRYPARQTLEASRAVARLHRLPAGRTVFVQQNPDAIDQGVFHNDVIAVGNRDLLFCHEEAFVGSAGLYDRLRRKLAPLELQLIEVPSRRISVQQAVASYLFNSQLVTLPHQSQRLVAPVECREQPEIRTFLDELVGSGAGIDELTFVDLRQSMRNGGGPACLRLRLVLSERELAALQPRVLLDGPLYQALVAWVGRHYRDALWPADVADPELLRESRTALDELTGIMRLGALYDFQR